MKFSVFFIIVFVIGVIFSDIVKDWNSWLFGFVFGLSIKEIAYYCEKHEYFKRRQLR